VQDIPISSSLTLALVTLDNGRDHTRPSTLGPVTLVEFAATLDTLKERAAWKSPVSPSPASRCYFPLPAPTSPRWARSRAGTSAQMAEQVTMPSAS
jgi:hypothetical protein